MVNEEKNPKFFLNTTQHAHDLVSHNATETFVRIIFNALLALAYLLILILNSMVNYLIGPSLSRDLF